MFVHMKFGLAFCTVLIPVAAMQSSSHTGLDLRVAASVLIATF
jgi:hypothetical protein